jgi:DUF3102 family protein
MNPEKKQAAATPPPARFGEIVGASPIEVKAQPSPSAVSQLYRDEARQIVKLHDEILTAARSALTTAIRAGEILWSIKEKLEHGNWLPWLKASVPFSERTARNYVACYKRQDELNRQAIAGLTEAYYWLCDSAAEADELEAIEAEIDADDKDEAPEPAQPPAAAATETGDQPVQPQKQRKGFRRITDRALERAQVKIDKELTLTVEQISRQSRAVMPEFGNRLVEHGNALIQQGQRLTNHK